MRRMAWPVTAALGTVFLAVTAASPAFAAPSPAPVPSAVPGQPMCTVDKELGGITGLVATANGYAVVVKASSGINLKVYLLDAECKRTGKTLAYNADKGARDPQDIQVAADGTFWVADTGDDPANPSRTSVGLWKLAPDGRATLYRFSYPDRLHAAQALLINGDGNPVFITDNPKGPAGIYVPAAALDPGGHPVALKHAGDFTPQSTGTDNKLGKSGQLRVTGAANSHDGKHVAIRTFSDAYEWSVTNGDVVAALLTGTPRITPLPNEPQGEAIAYSRDGADFLTVSDLDRQQGIPAQVLKYRPSPPVVAAQPASTKAPGVTGKADSRDWLAKLGFQDFLRIIGAVGVLGLLMVIGGIVGIRRGRQRARLAALAARKGGTSAFEEDPELAHTPTAALAAVSNGRRERRSERYDADRYDADPYQADPYQAGPYEAQRFEAERFDADRRYPATEPPPSREGYPDHGYGSGPSYGRAAPASPPPPPPPASSTYGQPEDVDRHAAPPPRPSLGPPSPGPRGDRGVARSHRPGNRRGSRDNGDTPRRGYSEQHDGFGDILDQ